MLHPKSVLIERCKALSLPRPIFQTTRTGPDHEPTFVSDVLINDEVYGSGQGSNKRDAERRACEEAIRYLDSHTDTHTDIHTDTRTPPDNATPPHAPSPSHRAESEASTMNPKHSPPDIDDAAEFDVGDFEGPWPMFPEVLAASLMVANSRIDPVLRGEEASQAVQMTALQLYKGCLAQLGEVIEVEES